jgi:hypothetical protein
MVRGCMARKGDMNIVVPIELIVTDEEATALAPTGKLPSAICNTCFAIVPLYRMVEHGQVMHEK